MDFSERVWSYHSEVKIPRPMLVEIAHARVDGVNFLPENLEFERRLAAEMVLSDDLTRILSVSARQLPHHRSGGGGCGAR